MLTLYTQTLSNGLHANHFLCYCVLLVLLKVSLQVHQDHATHLANRVLYLHVNRTVVGMKWYKHYCMTKHVLYGLLH